ncbi:hypothetical protein AB5J62_04880 [Amycolatopsis sp. cg5]|uniref:COG4315 family predicted lipoprotein n=1 Tax=Amycolatopsis sp. cg5 TaxID=3238802 RepID=UPI003524D8AA
MRQAKPVIALLAAVLIAVALMWWRGDDPVAPIVVGGRAVQAPVTEQLSPTPQAPPPTGKPVPPAPARIAAVRLPTLGNAVVDGDGAVLYRYDRDSAKPPMSACVDACTRTWPPVLTTGTPVAVGIDQKLVGTIPRADGTWQVTLGGWPLYRNATASPGKWNGQGVSLAWFAVGPDGSENLNGLPASPTG